MRTVLGGHPSGNTRGWSHVGCLVISFFCFLVFLVSISDHQCMSEDAKKTKAKQDCDTIAQAIQKYSALEGVMIQKLLELKGKYLTNIDTLKDPWGNSYQLDPDGCYIYSMGQDHRSDRESPDAEVNMDNIRVPYIGSLCLTGAYLDVNPEKEKNRAWARDVLHLRFNKPFTIIPRDFIFNDVCVSGSEPFLAPGYTQLNNASADPAANQYLFRFCKNGRDHYLDGSRILRRSSDNQESEPDRQWIRHSIPPDYPSLIRINTIDPWGNLYLWDQQRRMVLSAGPDGMIDSINPTGIKNQDNVTAIPPPEVALAGDKNFVVEVWTRECRSFFFDQDGKSPTILEGGVFTSSDRLEAIIVLPAGTSGSIIPGEHYINLTGNVKNSRESSAQIFCEADGKTPAVMSRFPIRISSRPDPVLLSQFEGKWGSE